MNEKQQTRLNQKNVKKKAKKKKRKPLQKSASKPTINDCRQRYDISESAHFCSTCFVNPIFRFWFLVTFGDEGTKIQKYYVIFVYILQGKMGKTEKNGKKTERKSRN